MFTMPDIRARAARPLPNLDFGPTATYIRREDMSERLEDTLLHLGHVYSDPAPSYTSHLRHSEVLSY